MAIIFFQTIVPTCNAPHPPLRSCTFAMLILHISRPPFPSHIPILFHRSSVNVLVNLRYDGFHVNLALNQVARWARKSPTPLHRFRERRPIVVGNNVHGTAIASATSVIAATLLAIESGVLFLYGKKIYPAKRPPRYAADHTGHFETPYFPTLSIVNFTAPMPISRKRETSQPINTFSPAYTWIRIRACISDRIV